MTVADRYTYSVDAEVKSDEAIKKRRKEFDERESVEEPYLYELVDKYIGEGCDEDGAFRQACEDKGITPSRRCFKY